MVRESSEKSVILLRERVNISERKTYDILGSNTSMVDFFALFLFQAYQQNQLILQLAVQQLILLVLISNLKWNSIRNYKYKLQRRSRQVAPFRQRALHPCNSGDILSVDVYECTELYEDDFKDLYQRVKESIQQSRNTASTCITTTSLTIHFRLLVVLQFLRQHLRYITLKQLYLISKV